MISPSYTITEESLSADNLAEAGIEIDEERTCMVVVSANVIGGELSFTMEDEEGNAIISKSAKNMLLVSEAVRLKPGHYSLYFEGGENLVGKQFAYEVIVK